MRRPILQAACVVALLMAAPFGVAAQDAAQDTAGAPDTTAAQAGTDQSGDAGPGTGVPVTGAADVAADGAAGQPVTPTDDAGAAIADGLPDGADALADPTEPPPRQPGMGEGTVVRSAAGALPDSPVLTINEAQLYAGSAWGRRVQAELEQLSRELAAENDRIYDELAAQEDELTTLRATLPAAEFRERAEAFDAHAQAVRAERQAAVRDLNDKAEAERQNFFAVSVPVFAEVMAERGATVILDQRMVFVSADAVDVTETLTARIDAEIGAGPAAQPGAPNQGKIAPAQP